MYWKFRILNSQFGILNSEFLIEFLPSECELACMSPPDEPQPSRASVRFYAELNEHLPVVLRYATLDVDCRPATTIRHVIEHYRIPAEEVDLLLVNGESAELDHKIIGGDRISVFPVFESFDIARTTRVRVRALREVRFVADVHLGKLASHLRMLGFDTLYRNDFNDKHLIRLSMEFQRTLLSKDHALIATPELTRAILVRSQDPREQLLEILNRLDLFHASHPFTRCIACNTILEPAEKQRIITRLPPNVIPLYNEFRTCPECDRLYWKGSHYQKMAEFMRELGIASIESS